jgi:hypothetical protein
MKNLENIFRIISEVIGSFLVTGTDKRLFPASKTFFTNSESVGDEIPITEYAHLIPYNAEDNALTDTPNELILQNTYKS